MMPYQSPQKVDNRMDWEEEGIEVRLPGGLLIDGKLVRQARCRPLTGQLEKRCGTIARQTRSLPGRISNLLGEVMASVGEQPMDAQCAGALCIADRQCLIQHIAKELEGEHLWLETDCTKCATRFDFEFDRSMLPVKPAGAEFPVTKMPLQGGTYWLRVPNGADQEHIVELDAEMAEQVLIMRCLTDASRDHVTSDFVRNLSTEEINGIETVLDEMAPDLGTRLEAPCPECGHIQNLEFNPYRIDELFNSALYEEIHTLASHYHWGEAEILALPKERRRLYLNFIDRNRGLVS